MEVWFPNEILIIIFKNLSAKELIKCRQVSRRWMEVVDYVSKDDCLWKTFCKKDFRTIAKEAMYKSNICRLWIDIYKSLSLWSYLANAIEFQDEFCRSSAYSDEILGASLLNNGTISVLKRSGIMFYDMSSLMKTERRPIYGDFTSVVAFGDAFVTLGNHLHLRISKREENPDPISADLRHNEDVTFYNAKYFIAVDRDIYFVTIRNEIYHYNINGHFAATQYHAIDTINVIALSYHNGALNMIKQNRNIYRFQNNTNLKLFNLERKKENIFHCLWQYNFIENLDWRVFYIWVAALRIHIPDGPLRNICMIKIYKDIFFIGCRNGVMLIYYKPYTNGELDFIGHEPVKNIFFSERDSDGELLLQPVLTVDVMEIKGGHKILVALPKKLVILTYVHIFE